MTIAKNIGRQYPLVARVDFTFASFGASGVAEPAIDMPVGSHVTGGALVIETAFDSGTSDAIDVGDGDTANEYLSAQDVKAAVGSFPLIPTEKEYTAPGVIGIEWTAVGTAVTVGAGYLLVEYVLEDRANENN